MKNAFKLDSTWKFNVIEVYDYRNPSLPYFPIFNYIQKHHATLEGDILEAGTYKGRLTAALGLTLKENSSSKTVFTYDTFSGFPGYHPNDDISNFQKLFETGKISLSHWEAIADLITIKEMTLEEPINTANISSSLDFSRNSLEAVERKFQLLGLDNIRINVGTFDQTMNGNFDAPAKLMLSIIDSDLYESYITTLNFVWPRTIIGGMIYLDEYYSLKFPGPRIAVNEFLEGLDDFELTNIARQDDDFERWAIIKHAG